MAEKFSRRAVSGLSFEEKIVLLTKNDTSLEILKVLTTDNNPKVRALLGLRTDLDAETYIALSHDKQHNVLRSVAGNRSAAIPAEVWGRLAEHQSLVTLVAANPNTPSDVLREMYATHGIKAGAKSLLWRMLTLGNFEEEFSKLYDTLPLMSQKYRENLLQIIDTDGDSLAYVAYSVRVEQSSFFEEGDLSVNAVYRRLYTYFTGDEAGSLPEEWERRVVEQFMLYSVPMAEPGRSSL